MGLHWHTVKAIDHQRLLREAAPADLTRVRRLIMDEFALHKGHRYATWRSVPIPSKSCGLERDVHSPPARLFFEWLGRDICRQIKAAAMDMNTAMDQEAQQHCPHVRIVYDLFHTVAKFGREMIDRVRVNQANRLREDRAGRR